MQERRVLLSIQLLESVNNGTHAVALGMELHVGGCPCHGVSAAITWLLCLYGFYNRVLNICLNKADFGK